MRKAVLLLGNYLFRPTFDLLFIYPLFIHSLPFQNKNIWFAGFALSYFGATILLRGHLKSWRYFSFEDLILQLGIVAVSSLSLVTLNFDLLLINFINISFLTLSLRAIRRLSFKYITSEINGKQKRVAIVGQRNHVALARSLKAQGYDIVGLIDEQDQGLYKSSFPVLGTSKNISTVIANYEIELVAVSGEIKGHDLQMIMQSCLDSRVDLKRYSFDVNDNHWSLKEFDLHELLGRKKVNVDLSELDFELDGATVLITGAGGSIGSEIARQIAGYNVKKLLILDSSEYNLFQIKKELNQKFLKNKEIIPLMADIKDRQMMEEIFKDHYPDRVYHAAAYKHVHLVEENPYSSILNNILGTHNLLKLSKNYGVECFQLISTDKAVNPTSIMGATKRICELLVSSEAKNGEGLYCSVRFGNVLGSSGSLIPILKKQIKSGGPVTITDPGMRRFFMSIPEAVSLVLKSSCISHNGAINILKMGDEVRIVDIARKLIKLCGYSETEIPIVFTGKQPGEKLYEELYLCGDELDTSHPDIVSLPFGDGLGLFQNEKTFKNFEMKTHRMIELARENNDEALTILQELINKTNREITKTESVEVSLGRSA